MGIWFFFDAMNGLSWKYDYFFQIFLSHIAQDGHFMPGAKLDDDKIYLTYVLRKDITSKGQLIKMLLALEKGTHVDLPYFKVVISNGQGIRIIEIWAQTPGTPAYPQNPTFCPY